MPATLDLPENFTAEQRDEVIDAAIEASKETVPSAEEAKKSETPAPGDEKPAEENAAAATTAGDEPTPATGSADSKWIDDEVKGSVAALGIPEERVKQFANREEFDRAIALMDFAVKQAATKAPEEKPEEKPAEQPRAKDGTFAPKPTDSLEVLEQFALDDELSAEDAPKLVDAFKAVAAELKEMREWRSTLEQTEQQRAAQAEQERFDMLVDALDEPDLFGKTGRETDKELENRKKIRESYEALLTGYATRGVQVQVDESFLRRILNMEFADHLTKKERKQFAEKIRKQSGTILGSGRTTKKDAEYTGPVEQDPELVSLYQKMVAENGG